MTPIVKKKYAKRAYIEEVCCGHCNVELVFTGEVLCSYPERYLYHCPKCEARYSFTNENRPGVICYEFEEN